MIEDEDELGDQVTRVCIITWRTGDEPDIDAQGISPWELNGLLNHCLDMIEVFAEKAEKENPD